jgi:hypothetical protein
MNAVYPFQKSPRCSATSKRTKRPCMAPAVTGWTVCRFHGARGRGPKGERNGMYRHGLNTNEAVKERRFLSDLLRQSRSMLCEEFYDGDVDRAGEAAFLPQGGGGRLADAFGQQAGLAAGASVSLAGGSYVMYNSGISLWFHEPTCAMKTSGTFARSAHCQTRSSSGCKG